MKPLDGARLKIARIHQQLIETPTRWASYGDVAKAVGWDDNWGPQRVAQLTQHMLWENGYSTMQIATQDGGNYWTEFDQKHEYWEVVAALDYALREARRVPDLPYDPANKVPLDELIAMGADDTVKPPDYSARVRRDSSGD